MEDKLNVRIATQKISAMRNENNHNMRTAKKARNQINQNLNYLFYNDEIMKFTNQDERVLKIRNDISKTLTSEENRHKELYEKNHKWKLKEKTRRSFIGGVLTFPKKINDVVDKVGLDEIWKTGVQAIQEIAEHLNTELHYITLHTDEEGLIHFQYSLNNFNNENGKSLKIERSSKGAELQDIAGNHFSKYGIYRGEKNTGRRHISTEDFKAMKNKLNNEIENLEDEVQDLNLDELTELKKKYKSDKIKKRVVDYAYRLKALEEREHTIEEKEKVEYRLATAFEKAYSDEAITDEEAKDLYKVATAAKLKFEKRVSKKILKGKE